MASMDELKKGEITANLTVAMMSSVEIFLAKSCSCRLTAKSHKSTIMRMHASKSRLNQQSAPKK